MRDEKIRRLLLKGAVCALFSVTFVAAIFPVMTKRAVKAQTGTYLNDVLVFAEMTSVEDDAAADADVVIVYIDGKGDAVFPDGNAALADVEFGSAVPCLYVSDEGSATAAKEVISATMPYAYVMSDRAELVADVRRTCTRANGAVDFRGRTDLTPQAIRDEVNAHAAKTAVVDSSQLTREDAFTLQKMLVTLCVQTTDGESRFGALACGVDGLLDADPEAARAVLSEGNGNMFAGRPLVASHRGKSEAVREDDGSPYAENTVEAARAAYDTYRCDFVEIDLYVTADGEVLVMHDSTLERMTDGGEGNIEEMTLAEIRRYQVFAYGHHYEISVLDDFFSAFRDDDLFFLLEIKSLKTECVDRAYALVEEYGMEGRVNFISFYPSQLARVREICPELSVSLLSSAADAGEAEKVMDAVNPLNASYSPNYRNIRNENILALHRYGIKVNGWTIGDMSSLFAPGFDVVTTDYCGMTEALPYEIVIENTYAFRTDKSFRFEGVVAAFHPRYDLETSDFIALPVNGDMPLVRNEDGTYSCAEEGEYTVVLVYNGGLYSIFSELHGKGKYCAFYPLRRSLRDGGCGGNGGAVCASQTEKESIKLPGGREDKI